MTQTPAQGSLDGFPLSPQQRRAWRVGDAGGPVCVWSEVRVEGDLDVAELARALGEVAARWEILRTRFARLPGMALPVQVIEPPMKAPAEAAVEIPVQEHTVAGETQLEGLLGILIATPPGADGAPPIACHLLHTAPGRALLLLRLSPLMADATGLSCLVDELISSYARLVGAESAAESAAESGSEPGSEPDTGPGTEDEEILQYADFAQWQNDGLTDEEGAEGRQLWRSCPLADDLPELPFEPPTVAPGSGGTRRFQPLQGGWGARADALAEQLEVPVEAVLMSAWLVLLGRVAGTLHPLVWCALDGRGYDELERALGLYHRFVPVLADLVGSTHTSALIEQLGQRLDEMSQWQEYLAWDVADAAPGEEPLELPWAFESSTLAPVRSVAGVRFVPWRQDGTGERCDLRLAVTRGAQGLSAGLWFEHARLTALAAERLAESFVAVLEQILDAPRRPLAGLNLLAPARRDQVLLDWGHGPAVEASPVSGAPGLGVAELVLRATEGRADAVAYSQGVTTLSHGAFAGRVAALVEALLAAGLRREEPVAVCLRRGPEMAAAFLAVLRAGGVAVALSADQPPRRLERVLADLQPRCILAEPATASRLPATDIPVTLVTTVPVTPATSEPAPLAVLSGGVLSGGVSSRGVPSGPLPGQLAYVVYTSGSRGEPKGIATPHHGVVNYLSQLADFLRLGPGDTVLQLPELIYDASMRDLWTPLLGGARVVLASAAQVRDPAALLALMREQRVTALLSVVPTVLRALLAAGRDAQASCPALHTLLLSGEKLRPEDVEGARRLFAPDARVVNLYGPTETTMTSTAYPLPAAGEEPLTYAGTVAIGRPIPGVQVFVTDAALRPVLPGTPGEAVIGGAGLARGYWRQPALTAASFVPDPLATVAGSRLLRTGDLVQHTDDGVLVVLGRRDQQIKLRGVRVEPGEIEAELRRLRGVRDAVVLARQESETAPPVLTAWVVAEDPLAAIPPAERYELPNGLPIRHLNRYETDFFYQQIFEDRVDVKKGLDLPPGAVVLDVGANIGLFSLYAHLAQDDVRVFAFEPIPETCSVLRSNLDLYGADAHVECCGLSNRSGSVRFAYYPLSSCQSGYYPDESQERYMLEAIIERQSSDPEAFSLARDYFSDLVDRRMQRQMIDCPLKTVSQVLAEQGLERVDLLKIDVEKSELDVLEGVSDEDWPKIRQLSIEAHDLEGRLDKITQLLESKGYRVAVQQEDALLDETCLFNVYASRAPSRDQTSSDQTSSDQTSSDQASRDDRLPSAAPAPRLPQHLLDGRPDAEGLRRALAEVLPETLVPASFVLLDELPRTPGGKVDVRALPEPEAVSVPGVARDEPTPEEEIVVGIFADLLQRERLGLDDDFFVLGGHSLLATQAVLRIQQAFEVDLSLQKLFELPTVRGLTRAVTAAAERLRGHVLPPLVPVEARDELPLSYEQQRLWFLGQMRPGDPGFNLPGALRVTGPLAVPLLHRAMTLLVARHESLRTRFTSGPGGLARQVVDPPTAVPLPVVDLRGLPEAVRRAHGDPLLTRAAQHRFDLARGPLFRGLLLREARDVHAIHFNLHHIIGDAWSNGILVRELAALLDALGRGVPSPLPELPIQYADYAHWQRQWLQGEALQELVDSWRRTLEGAPPRIELPLDRPRGSGRRGGSYLLQLPTTVAEQLEALGRSHQCSLFMTLLAALDVTLHSYSGATDLVVGADVAHRSRVETEALIGFFVNQIVLRVDLGGNPTFSELLARVRKVALSAYERQDLPFDRLVEVINPDRDAHHSPIFQVKLVVQNAPGAVPSLGAGLAVEAVPMAPRAAAEDLLVNAQRSSKGLSLTFKYNAELFVASTIEAMAERLRGSLEVAAAEPTVALAELVAQVQAGERERQSRQAEKRGATLGSKLQNVRRRAARPESRS